jgi:hypothetical protein
MQFKSLILATLTSIACSTPIFTNLENILKGISNQGNSIVRDTFSLPFKLANDLNPVNTDEGRYIWYRPRI